VPDSVEAADGDINLNAKNINLTATESITTTSTLATSITAGGLASITAGGAATITAGGAFTATARILGIYYYQGTTNARLYVAADGYSSTYTTNGIIQNAYFNSISSI
jgi:hypothetical protein